MINDSFNYLSIKFKDKLENFINNNCSETSNNKKYFIFYTKSKAINVEKSKTFLQSLNIFNSITINEKNIDFERKKTSFTFKSYSNGKKKNFFENINLFIPNIFKNGENLNILYKYPNKIELKYTKPLITKTLDYIEFITKNKSIAFNYIKKNTSFGLFYDKIKNIPKYSINTGFNNKIINTNAECGYYNHKKYAILDTIFHRTFSFKNFYYNTKFHIKYLLGNIQDLSEFYYNKPTKIRGYDKLKAYQNKNIIKESENELGYGSENFKMFLFTDIGWYKKSEENINKKRISYGIGIKYTIQNISLNISYNIPYYNNVKNFETIQYGCDLEC